MVKCLSGDGSLEDAETVRFPLAALEARYTLLIDADQAAILCARGFRRGGLSAPRMGLRCEHAEDVFEEKW